MNNTIIDNQGSSSSIQPSGTPTTSSDDASSSTSASPTSDLAAVGRLPLAGPMAAGILVCIIAIATVVVISFLTGRSKRSRRRRTNSFEELGVCCVDWTTPLVRLIPLFHCFYIDDECLSDSEPPKQKRRRHSRHSRRLLRQTQHSRGTMELDVRKSIPQGVVIEGGSRSKPHETRPSDNRQRHSDSDSTNSTLSLNANPMNDHRSNHPVVNDRQASTPSSDLATTSPNQVGRQRLNALIQQRAALRLASGDTGDKSVYNELILLEEQIQNLILSHPDASHDTPPPYEHNS